jgi:hypothetical protein
MIKAIYMTIGIRNENMNSIHTNLRIKAKSYKQEN